MKTFLKPEKMFGPVHGYRIDWDETVAHLTPLELCRRRSAATWTC